MNWRRLFRHLWTPAAAARMHFPPPLVERIGELVRAGETRHGGEVCFAAEAAFDLRPLLDGLTSRERALQLFAELQVWDTPDNNGVLVYLLLADHDIEIVADRGIAERVDDEAWQQVCRGMETRLRRGEYFAAVEYGLQAVADVLAEHFPADRRGDGGNRLSDRPIIL